MQLKNVSASKRPMMRALLIKGILVPQTDPSSINETITGFLPPPN